jgi:hypothetical protein
MNEQPQGPFVSGAQAPQAMQSSPMAMNAVQTAPSPVSTHSETIIGDTAYRMLKLNTFDARMLQLRIGKTLGAPLIKFFGSKDFEEGAQETDLPADAISEALMSVSPEESVNLIKDLCELCYNGKTQKKVNYMNDFSGDEAYDLELMVWVMKEQFGNFISALLKSNISSQALGMMSLLGEQKE